MNKIPQDDYIANMKILELFAGSRSIGKAAESLGLEVFSTDIEAFEGVDLVKSILNLTPGDIPWRPDIIWASPPCTTYSVAALWRHRDGPEPKSEAAKEGDRIVKATLSLISFYNPKYFFIENPRGMLRKMPFMQGLDRHTVTYCQYGDSRMKPTDIWTNCTKWEPKPMCKRGSPCHTASPRGSNTGTQGMRSPYERSKIPEELCIEILKACK